MNILPKKRWHVRTKENIARVRRDEAQAAEEQKALEQRAKLAEQEARTNVLRYKARAIYDGRDTEKKEEHTSNEKNEHVNFFKELEEGLVAFTGTNKEYEQEKKEEKEKYEKQIGYLTYLGQDTVETTGNISWYNKLPSRLLPEEKKNESTKEKEVNEKSKQLIDPLNSIRRYIGMHSSTTKKEENKASANSENIKFTKGEKRKRKSDDSSSSEEDRHHKSKKKRSKKRKRSHSKSKAKRRRKDRSDDERNTESKSIVNLELLRAKRLQREKEEKLRAERHLAKLRGETLPEDKPVVPTIEQKYSSQFNPHIAKQNFPSEKRKKTF